MENSRLLNIDQIENLTNLSRSTLWRLEKKGRFPRRVQISMNRVGWDEAEVLKWIKSKLSSRGADV